MRHLNPNPNITGTAREPQGPRCSPQARWRHMPSRIGPPPATLHSVPNSERSAYAPAARTGRRPIDRLTRRQMEVLSLMAEGHSNASIARTCYISEKAVVQHTSQIYDRLDLPNEAHAHRRVQAVVMYLSHHQPAAA